MITLQTLRQRSARVVASLLLLSAASAHAGLIQWQPLSLLQDILLQPSVQKAVGISGILVRVPRLGQTLYSPYTSIDPYGVGSNSLSGLVQASGLGDGLEIPLFYIDSFPHSNAVGLGLMDDNGVALLTSFQTRLIVAPGYRDFASCTADHGHTCWYDVPEITQADVTAGVWRSAEILAHEILHNLGLQHSPTGLMAPTLPPLSKAQDPASYLLTDAEVQDLLDSPFLKTHSSGFRYIDVVPFSVLLAVPEPASALLVLLALGGLAASRRNAPRTPQRPQLHGAALADCGDGPAADAMQACR